MKTYTKQDFHNPEQLTRQQVGEKYRLLLSEEVDGRFRYGMGIEAQCVGTPINSELNWIRAEFASCSPTTYRVPIATPLPGGTVLSSNECCFSDALSAGDDMAGLDDVLGKQGYLNVNYNGITEVEQSASRIAKMLDERADCLAEVMLYRGENGDWTVEAGNPNACVMLGEVPGIIRAEGSCLLETLSNVENALTECEEKPRKKRVYCAGPMSSHPEDFNFPAFYAAAESLEKKGYFPINPAELDRVAGYTLERIKELDPVEFQEFLRGAAKRDLDALQQCDAIALMPGWENSKGAKAEKAVAEWLGLEVMYLPGALNFERLLKHGAKPYLKYSDDPCDGEAVKEGSGCANDSDKQPYNSDERAEWDVSGLMSKLQSSIAPDDPKGAAGAKKPPMHLLPPNALIETAKAMGHGAAKYGAWNFIETTVCASTYVGALGRHWAAYARSEDIDPDSGLPHLALIAANCFVLLTAQQQGTLRDDRPKLRQI